MGALLRFSHITSQDLWYDESFTAWLVHLPWCNMLRAIRGDVHPPLFYVIAKLASVTHVGDRLALRLPSAFCSILAVALTYQLAVELRMSRRAAIIASWISALSPMQVWYAQEARMYALLLVLVQLAAIAMLRAQWWYFSLWLVAMLYTHNMAVIYAFILIVLVALSDVRRAVVCAVASVLPYALWLPVLAEQLKTVHAAFWVQKPTVGALALVVYELAWHTLAPAGVSIGAGIVSGITTVAAISDAIERKLWNSLVLAFGPLVLAFALSLTVKPVLIHRVMIGCSTFIYILIADAIARARRWYLWCVAALPIVVVTLSNYYTNPDVQRMDLEKFIAPVAARYESGDAILHTSIASYVLLAHRFAQDDSYLWQQSGDLSQSLTDVTKDAMLMRQVSGVDELLQDYERVWVYYSDTPVTSDTERRYVQFLMSHYAIAYLHTWYDASSLVESGVLLLQ